MIQSIAPVTVAIVPVITSSNAPVSAPKDGFHSVGVEPSPSLAVPAGMPQGPRAALAHVIGRRHPSLSASRISEILEAMEPFVDGTDPRVAALPEDERVAGRPGARGTSQPATIKQESDVVVIGGVSVPRRRHRDTTPVVLALQGFRSGIKWTA